ncbi:hypothetical protein [Neptunicella marina]|uniref:Uncharacterized protein n=1 Tax=Neptunicella marina TaxID=2125989 RepID=A0A8J6IPK1_9ALTE|nr:hypothetical protein [Neptunicella marina]MBC3764791.1 hypothetical protein [Neptunicella marina]
MLPFMIILLVSALGSFFVLAISGVGDNLLLVQAAVYGAAIILLIAVHSWRGKYSAINPHKASPDWLIPCLILLLAGLLSTVFSHVYPARWLSLGGFNLYMAAVVMPPLIVITGFVLTQTKSDILAVVLAGVTAIVLAVQPDLAQLLAWLAALIVLTRLTCSKRHIRFLLLLTLVSTLWAALKNDPLKPVSYVEEVFKTAIAHHIITGSVIIAIAAALVVCFVACAKSRTWLYPLAAYYVVIFIASVFGITPAPLLGYGAGPVLGYVLAVMAILSLNRYHQPQQSTATDVVGSAA